MFLDNALRITTYCQVKVSKWGNTFQTILYNSRKKENIGVQEVYQFFFLKILSRDFFLFFYSLPWSNIQLSLFTKFLEPQDALSW